MVSGERRSNDYHFLTRWRVPGDVGQVADVLSDAPALARWWPAVYLDVCQVDPGDAQGLGKVVDLHTKGWLPYTLHWRFRVTEARHPHSFTIVASGDFEGVGVWTLAQDGSWVNVTYDWRIRAEKALLRRGSLLMRPIFSINHRWAMARGEESLRLELARRRATSPAERASIPPPPPPTSFGPLFAASGLLLALALLSTRIRAARRREAAAR